MIYTLLALSLISAPPTTAADFALRCVCQTHPNKQQCVEDRREDVTQTVADLMEITHNRTPDLPYEMLPSLVAVACGEGGFRNYPTCGGSPTCNDGNTSDGMFQIKPRFLGRIFAKHNPKGSLHNHKEAGKFYLDRLILGAERVTWKSRCPRPMGTLERWNVALFRLGRGPLSSPPIKASRACAPVPFSKETRCVDIPARPGVQRCTPGSKYAQWAAKWYTENPSAWLP
jgi:hypothetical protein